MKSGIQSYRAGRQCTGWFWITFLAASLITLAQAQHRSPKITEHPKDVLVKKNEPTTLNCKAEGKPDPTIEWYKDGELLNNSPSNDGRRIFLPFGDLFFLSVSDGRRKDFGPDGLKESDSGIYWCIARNIVGTVRSRNASLQVGVIRDDFRLLPQHTKALVGETVRLSCQPPRGTPEPQVLWQRNGQSLDTRLASSRLQSVDGGNLVIKDVRATDAGRYQCLAINIAGTRSSPEITLSVHQKPYFKEEPRDITVLLGDAAIFSCDVDGMPKPSLDWYRQDAQMPKDRADRIVGGLKIRDTRPEDEGLYFCQSSNELGSVRASALLSVHSRPKFISRPRDLRLGLNEGGSLECSAAGNPPPTIFWRKEGTQELLLPSSSAAARLTVSPEGRLSVRGATKDDSGTYVCSAVSPAGGSEALARLEVARQDQLPPPIINVVPKNQTLPLKSMASVPCYSEEAGGSGISWQKDGAELGSGKSDGSRVAVSANGTLQINDLRSSDAGLYTCVASSPSGSSSSSGYLWVESPTNPNIAFHRTNPSLLPPAPSRPALNESSPSSLTLSWTWAPKQAPARSSPLLGFTLEAFSPDEPKGWVVLGHRIYGGGGRSGEVSYTVDGLRPNSRYLLYLRAENPEGLSPASPVSELMRTRAAFRRAGEEELDELTARNQLSTSEIELISSEPASSTSIRISWKVSKSAIKFIDGYYLRYREILAGQQPDSPPAAFNLLTVVAQKTDAYSHVIPSLKKFVQYETFVSPFYRSVEGQPSNSRTVITAEDRPSAPPQSLLTKMLNTTAASIRWSPPPQTHSNGVLTGYRVEVRGNDSRIHAEMNFGSNITFIVLNNLTLGRSYLVRVCASTSVGSGPFGPPLTISMEAGFLEPSAGSGVSADDDSSQILKEVWFIILMGFLLFIFLLLLIIILYSRRKSHGKKDHISSVVVAPHTDSQFVSAKQSLWIDQRWGNTDTNDKDSNRSKSKLLANHANGDLTEATDYAEVDPHNLTTFYNNTCSNNKGQPHHQQMLQLQQPDLTPYATTTLIQRRPNYDPLPMNGGPLSKNLVDNYRDSDQFSSGRSKLSMGSNNFNKFKSSHPSPSPSPSAPMKMVPMSSRMGCYPSPGPNRSHHDPLLHHHHYPPNNHHHSHANENLYHIGEIFNPNKSASATNGFAEAVYQTCDPEEQGFLPHPHHPGPLIDREIQSSLPSLASADSCNLYAEAEDVIPQTAPNNYILNGGRAGVKNSRSTSPAYSSDSFNSGKSGSKRLYHKGKQKKFDSSCKSLERNERRHLAPLLPGRTDESSTSSYNRPHYQQNGFQKLPRFQQRPTVSASHLNHNEYLEWQGEAAMKLAKTLKESNA